MEREGFFERTYELVRQIPRGRVASYGQIAAMLGQPRKARFVGFAMHASPGQAAGVPCHRVVFKDGSLAAGYAFGGPSVQRQLLEEEGLKGEEVRCCKGRWSSRKEAGVRKIHRNHEKIPNGGAAPGFSLQSSLAGEVHLPPLREQTLP